MVTAEAPVVGTIAHGVVDFGGQQDPISLARVFQEATDDSLAFALIVAVGRVKDVEAGIQRHLHDVTCGALWGRVSKVGGAQTYWRYLHTGSSETPVLHVTLPALVGDAPLIT